MGDTTGLRAKEIFLAALDEPAEEREAFVARLCGADERLAGRVGELLAAHDRAGAVDRVMARRRRRKADARRDETAGAEPLRFGDYELESELASGAMGTVYRARQVSLGRRVALKMLRVGRFATEGEVRRFRAEAEAVARLDHPGIVPVYEVGEEEGRHFFSMKLVDGPSLETAGERFRDPRAAAGLVARVARAVHHAHLHGVLHRDLKPSNILLDAEGSPYVADFGIAKRIDEAVGREADETATGWICGTPSFMAPEQAVAGGDVTVASDVYSLGSLLYTLLAGRPPFTAGSWAEVLRKLREEEPPRLRAVDRDLETIVRTALAKEPARRYASAEALARDLERWLEHLPIAARPASLLERARLLYRRRPVTTTLAAVIALLVLLLAAGATASSVLLSDRLRRAQEAEGRANERLRGSLLAQARALRLGSSPGRRADGLALLEQAAAIHPGPDLRDEAVTCLSALDLAPAAAWPLSEDEQVIGVDPERGRLALAHRDGGVVLVGPEGGRERELPALEGRCWSARFTDDGGALAVTCYEERTGRAACVRVWDLERGTLRFEQPGLVFAGALDFDPAGRRLAVGLPDRVALLDAGTGEELARREVPERVTGLRFSPDGEVLCCGLAGAAALSFLALPGLEEMGASPELPEEASGFEWSPGGELFAVGCHDFRTYVFRWPELELERELRGHQAEVSRLHFGGDGLIASYSWDETTRLWDVHTGEQRLVADACARGFSADGRQLAFSDNESFGWWRVEQDETFGVLYGHEGKSPLCVDADPRGRWLATGGLDGVWIRDLASGRHRVTLPCEDVEALEFAPDGGALYVSATSGLQRWPLPDAVLEPDATAPETWSATRCGRMDLAADGGALAAVHAGGVDVFVDVGEGLAPDRARGLRLEGHSGMDNPALSPDGELVAVGSWHGSGARVWRTRDGQLVHEVLVEERATQPGFSPDGELLVVGTRREYRVWRVADWSVVRSIPRPLRIGNLPGALAFEAETGRMAVASDNRTVQLVEPASGTLLATLAAADPQPVTAMAFLPGGAGLAVAANTRRTLIWRLPAIERELARRGLTFEVGSPAR